jgi:Domain of unknown function (DUF1772)
MAAKESAAKRFRLCARLLDLAQLGLAEWLFGNIYEAVVKIPDRLTAEPFHDASTRISSGSMSVLGPGSPVRYYLPAAPITLASTLAAVIIGWASAGARRWLVVTAASTMSGVAITAYVVRRVNFRLFFAAEPPPPAERDALIRIWYRANVLRILATSGALLAAYRAKQVIIVPPDGRTRAH